MQPEPAVRTRVPAAADRDLTIRKTRLRVSRGIRAGEHSALHRESVRLGTHVVGPRPRGTGRSGQRPHERVRLHADAVAAAHATATLLSVTTRGGCTGC